VIAPREARVSALSEKSKQQDEGGDKGQDTMPAEAKEGMEPCESPQAQEALRFNVIEDECDDGVD